MNVSFIIPHKGREEMLRQTVASIASLDWDLNQIEVIVVSQNTQVTESELAAVAGDLNLTVIHLQADTISQMRNTGINRSQGDYLAFIDADIELSPNWLRVVMDEVEKPGVVMASAWQKNSDTPSALEQIRTALSNIRVDCDLRFLPGRNLFVHRQYASKVGGFPEHLVTCEDYYFTDQIAQLGRLRYVSAADYIHIGEDKDYKTLWQKEIWRGQSNLQSMAGRRFTLSELPSLLVPIGIAVCALLMAVSMVSLNWPLAFVWLGCALLPVFAYSLRLKSGAGKHLPLTSIFKFYLVYFPARSIGTLLGLFKTISPGKKAHA